MEENDIVEDFGNNNNNIDELSIASIENDITQKEIKNISVILFPSIVFLIASIIALIKTKTFCSKQFSTLIKLMVSLFSLNLIYCISRVIILIYYSSNYKLKKITTILAIIIDILGLCIIIITCIIYFKRNKKCFDENIYPTILIFCFALLGITIICKKILKIILIGVSFPILVCYFLRAPNQFFSHFGIDPEIIRRIPTISASINHCNPCIICAQDIKLGQDIIILNCPGHHYFHGNCIKNWLNVKLSCPVCRSENIL